MMRDLDLLPPDLRGQSRMEREIALPYPQVLEAIDVLEAAGALLLGWEPLASYGDGGFGGYPAPGLGGLSGIEVPETAAEWEATVRESARIHRETIEDEWRTRESTPPRPDVELIFCVTALTREQWEQEHAL